MVRQQPAKLWWGNLLTGSNPVPSVQFGSIIQNEVHARKKSGGFV